MTDAEKLRVLLPHWITHNREHGKEFTTWAERIEACDCNNSAAIAAELARAVSACEEVTAALEKAMELAGGPLDHVPDALHHSHDHHHHH